jgi:4-amino-4-deoxy-L-arabinose transferase-like glycosyltransferase
MAPLGLSVVFLLGLLPFAGTFFEHYPDERNYTNAAILMIQSGDYFTPRWPDGAPRAHKPLLTYWVVAGSYALFGVNLPASRVPFMVAGAAIVALTYATALRLTGRRRTAALAAVITGSQPQLILASIRAIPDVLLCLFMLVSAYGFLSLIVLERRTRGAYWAAYLGAALAVMTKGLPALGFVIFAWAFTWLARGGAPRSLLHGPSMLVSLVVATSWYAGMYWIHGARVLKVFGGDQVARKVEFLDGGWLYGIPAYLAVHVINLLPWSLLLIPIALFDRSRLVPSDPRARRALWFVLPWSAVMAVAFGLGRMVEPRYLLPAGPLLAILLADLVERADRRVTAPALAWLVGAMLVVFAAFGLTVSLLDAVLVGWAPALRALGLFALVAAAIALAALRGGALARAVGVGLAVFAAFPLTVLTLGPALDADGGVRAIARELEGAPREGGAPVLLVGPEALANKLRVISGGRIAIDSWSPLPATRDAWPAAIVLPSQVAAPLDLTGYRATETATEVRSVPVDGLLRALSEGRVPAFLDARRDRYVVAVRPQRQGHLRGLR